MTLIKPTQIGRVGIVILVIFAVWVAIGTADFIAVSCGVKPLFSFPLGTADDGGSGMYYGLGYAFDIEGHFMPDDESYGVRSFDYYLFGWNVLHIAL